MQLLSSTLALLLPALAATSAAAATAATTTTTITLILPASPNPFTLPPSTHATLSTLGAHHAAPLSTLNTFVFRNVSAGSYLVDVHCPTEAFRPLRIDVGPPSAAAASAEGGAAAAGGDGADRLVVQAWETFRGNDWGNKGEVMALTEGGGVHVRWMGKKNYFMERPKFSILSILKNPMILMGLVSMLIFIGMPYLMDNMDPEMKAEFEAQQRKGGLAALMGGGGGGGEGSEGVQQPQNPLGDFDMAAFLAGSKKKDAGNGGGGEGAAKGQGVRR
ncbi:putative PEP5 protein [Purpureocillium lavendulum]|uniref:PEP5 protein n=1 Tax=Purpureocillium lavendulum TaxID=1247861 RepID=A0AB34FJE8_9HYPO|nr:putative PEP5 protein [Purpureocillium lavendulum]